MLFSLQNRSLLEQAKSKPIGDVPPPSVYQVCCLFIFVQQVYFIDKCQVSFTYRPSKDATIMECLFKGRNVLLFEFLKENKSKKIMGYLFSSCLRVRSQLRSGHVSLQDRGCPALYIRCQGYRTKLLTT